MISLRSSAIAVVTLTLASLGFVPGAQACGDWDHGKARSSHSRSSFSSGPVVYGYYSGDRISRNYRSDNRSGYVQVGTGRGDYGPRGGWRDRALKPKR
jgi:hypothetical protein